MKYDHPTAFSLWDEAEHTAIARVIRNGQFTMGPEVAAFEREFSEFHGRKHCIMVNSGSSANLVAVAALFNKSKGALRRDDDRLSGRSAMVPAIAWSTTYAPLAQYGLRFILRDVDSTWNAPPPARDEQLPRLVVVCPILGNPGYGPEWLEAALNSGSYVIEDTCESFGATYSDGSLCGTVGHLSTFSFFYSHQISAIEGGAILTDNDELADWCRIIRAHGWTRDVKECERFEDEYNFVTLDAYNVRPLEMHAAVAREQLKKTAKFKAARVKNWRYFRDLAKDLPIVSPTMLGEPNPFGIQFTCDQWEDRADLVNTLRANKIDCRLPTGGSFHLHKYGKAYANQETPRADEIHRRGLFLGNAPWDLSPQIEKAVRVMRALFDSKARRVA